MAANKQLQFVPWCCTAEGTRGHGRLLTAAKCQSTTALHTRTSALHRLSTAASSVYKQTCNSMFGATQIILDLAKSIHDFHPINIYYENMFYNESTNGTDLV